MVKKRDKRNQPKKRKIHFCHHHICHSNLKKSKAMKHKKFTKDCDTCGTAFKLASELEMHVAERHTKKSSEASRRCRICGTYSEGDELVCLFCGGLVDAPVESDSGDSNPDGWRFSFSRSFISFFFLFFFSLLLCFFW